MGRIGRKVRWLVALALVAMLVGAMFQQQWYVAAQGVFSPAFGKITVGASTSEELAGRLWACKFYLPVTGEVTKLTAYIQGTNPNSAIKAAIYDHDDTNNKPNNRVAIMSTTLTIGSTTQWQDLVLDSPATLSGGYYWLAVHFGVKASVLYYDSGSTDQWQAVDVDYSTGPPATWGTSAATNAWEASIYATYTGPPWASYSDATHETDCDIFDVYAIEHWVHMYGSANFTANVTYKVIYWDGLGNKRVVDGSIQAGGDGSLSSSHEFVTGDEAGDWQCTVYYPDTYDPASYNATDLYIVAGDISYGGYAFNMDAAAIPEFSTVMAAIGVAGLCFGIYYWMRKRYRRQAAMAELVR